MSTKLRDETTERWLLTGQELLNFVLKSSECLHNVINRPKISSIQTIKAKKRTLKRKINSLQKNSKNKCKPCKPCKKNCSEKSESTQNMNNWTQSSTQQSLEYDLDLSWSSCEDLNEIPMEDLLSSPSWKQIVEQNSFIWP